MNQLLSTLQSSIDWIVAIWPRNPLILQRRHPIPLVAHRGAHEDNLFIENTLPAFQWCIDHSVWGVEMDLQWTSDDTPVILHDPHCGRNFLRPEIRIEDITFAELRREVPDIPSLEEVLSVCCTDIHLMLEIKTILSEIQNKILSTLLESRIPGDHFHLLALDLSLYQAITFAPKNCFLPVAETNTAIISQTVQDENWAGLCGYYLFLNKKLVRKHHHLQQKIGVGFIDHPSTLIRELEKEVDWIFTDKVISLCKFIDGHHNSSQ